MEQDLSLRPWQGIVSRSIGAPIPRERQTMKTCNRCKIEKPLTEFNKKRESGVQPYCKPCQGEYQREFYEDTRLDTQANIYKNRKIRKKSIHQFLGDFYSSNPCVDCGEDDILVLEFDHVIGKEFGLNLAIRDAVSIERIKEELTKGEVRCCNCHRRLTSHQQNSWRVKYVNGELEDMEYEDGNN